MDPSCSREPIRPYVSKRKRKVQQQETSDDAKKPLSCSYKIKDMFLTNEVIYRQSLKTVHSYSPPFACISTTPVAKTPLWTSKWCEKFSHLIACTAEKSVKLFDIFKDNNKLCNVWASLEDDSLFKDLDWSRTSRQLASCNFGGFVKIWDFLDGGKISCKIDVGEILSVIRYWPEDDNLVIVGGDRSFLATYDIRSGKIVSKYSSQCGNVLNLDILHNSSYFIASGDSVNEQSANHSLTVWDFATGAKISDQIFHEKYTCPKICTHPSQSAFLAQTNGGYIARFNSTKPFHLDKYLRYDKHRVEGFSIGLDISPDGRVVASGSCDGSVIFYKYKDSSVLRTLKLPLSSQSSSLESFAGITVQYHPVLPTMVAVGDWSGRLHILK